MLVTLKTQVREHPWRLGVGVLLVAGLYLSSRFSYLLFHTLAEVFSIVVAFSVFMVTWSSRRFLQNGYLLFVGVGYLALGLLDLLHTLAYQGMVVFPTHAFAANQLWIATRYLESLTLLAGFLFLGAQRQPRLPYLLLGFAGVTALIVASVFLWRIFPVCFVAGQGQTRFKIVSEFIIIGILAVDVWLLRRNRAAFDDRVFKAILGSLVLAIGTELAFTIYVSNFGLANMVGHFLKIGSFALIYVALVKTGIEHPYDLVFRELARANEQLTSEVSVRRAAEAEKEAVIGQLRTALEEIRTLRGVIPICSHCRKVRDEAGSWSQLEAYVHEHSQTQFSHGICPDCRGRHFGPPG